MSDEGHNSSGAAPVDSAPASVSHNEGESFRNSSPAAPPTEPAGSEESAPSTLSDVAASADKTGLLDRARQFLASPQIQQQDEAGKRRFLAEKGLGEEDIKTLMREPSGQQQLLPPPRTYPQPPPSNLPGLLLAAARILTWVAGGSAMLLLVYYRFFLPRIVRTAASRKGIITHQRKLMERFNDSLKTMKDAQKEDLKDLPRPDPNVEPELYRDCRSVKAALLRGEVELVEMANMPTVTLLRCAIEELRGPGREEELPTTEDIFRVLEGRIPWLLCEDGLLFEGRLWETLNTCSLFAESEDAQGLQRWGYVPTEAPPTPPILTSLETLTASLTNLPEETENRPCQRTMQTLSDFTGYLSSQVYTPFRTTVAHYGMSSSGNLGPVEEDMRKEIRALKGLVLNRRTFIPFYGPR